MTRVVCGGDVVCCHRHVVMLPLLAMSHGTLCLQKSHISFAKVPLFVRGSAAFHSQSAAL